MTSRRVVASVIVVLFACLLPRGSTVAAETGGGGEGVTLDGAGSDSIRALMSEVSSVLYESPASARLTYLHALGDRLGREAFTEGKLDFVVSGTPFTETDTERLEGKETISMPVSVGAAAFLVHISHDNGYRTYMLDPDDPESVTFGEYAGPLRIPDELLARVMLEKVTQFWAEPAFIAALGLGAWQFVAAGPLIPFVSSTPGATNWYVARFVQQKAAQDWKSKGEELLVPDADVGESWPFLTTPSRPGSADLSGILAAGHGPQGSGGPFPPGGTIAPVVPADAKEWLAKGDPQLVLAHIQNGAGEWVLPTPETLSKAAEAGESDRLPALDRAVAGAYPLVWINRLYAPAAGLSVDKVNAVATLVRWAVTHGQDSQAEHGEGRLPETLVEEALAGADELVEANCVGDGYEVVKADDGGPYWPAASEPGEGFTLCSAPTADSGSTDSATQSYTAPAYGPNTLPGAATSSTPGTASTGTPGAGDVTEEDAADAMIPVAMPLPPPADGSGGFDRVATLLVGVAVWSALAPQVARRIRRRP